MRISSSVPVHKRGLWRLLVVAVVALAVTVAGCGSSSSTGGSGTSSAPKTQKVSVRLDWIVWPEHAGYFVAQAKGWYKQERLDVDLREGQGSGQAVQLVAAGKDTFGTANPSAVVEAAAKGAPITMVADPFQDSGYSVAFLSSSGIRSPRDLIGKTFAGIAGSPGYTLFPAFLKVWRVNPKSVKQVTVQAGSEITGLKSKRFDAVEWNTFAAPLSVSQGAKNVHEFGYGANGVINLGWGMVVNNRTLASDPSLVQRFVRASLKGWTYALAHPDEAAALVAKTAAKSTIKQATMAEMIRALAALTHTKTTSGQPLGCMAREDWAKMLVFEKQYVGVKNPPAPEKLYTNRFVPGCAA
jgi:NitT/TauT family transport system substrate-binding protein